MVAGGDCWIEDWSQPEWGSLPSIRFELGGFLSGVGGEVVVTDHPSQCKQVRKRRRGDSQCQLGWICGMGDRK